MSQVQQVGGDHYTATTTGMCPECRAEIQHWDWALRMPYLEASGCKYISRHKEKGGFEGLLKALSFLFKIMETYYPHDFTAWKEKHLR
jgi:hypothetical protein